uniref:Secreted protein n=1 Tax=Cacopsylla melanoneura TaxID=428564 RepID=A0A8D9EJS0_9HEMI
MSKYAQCAHILVLVSCVYFVNCRDTSSEQERRKHQRRSEGSSVDLTLSNTIDVTTEESNIWWPWASYEEWKQAHHFDMMPRDEAQADAEEVTLSTTEGARLPERVTDQIRSLRRVQHKRSKKNNNTNNNNIACTSKYTWYLCIKKRGSLTDRSFSQNGSTKKAN